MNCERCGRPLSVTVVRIKMRGGDVVYGPKCAKKAGLWERKRRSRVIESKTALDPRQMALELAA